MNKLHAPSIVLIVEPDPDVQAMIVRTLAAPQRVLVKTQTLAQARSAMDSIIPDMIILDLNLPDGNGMELMRTMSRRHHLHGTNVFVVCADRALSTRVSVFAAGARRCFLKPLDPSVLLDSVTSLEQRAQARNRSGTTRREPYAQPDSIAVS